MQRETPSEALRDSERLLEAATRRSEHTRLRCELQSARHTTPPPLLDDAPTQPCAAPFPIVEEP
jgi:hypothetical protein